uniref:Cytochrome P450 3076A1 n=1 Tax=Paracyclopina nana TaxID=565004 RepID=A0A0F7J1Q7_PARNA|nr:cytochrome P450 3076A1 [Paracyclopina nana]
MLAFILSSVLFFLFFLRNNMERWLGWQPPGPLNLPLMGSCVSLLKTGKNVFREPHLAMSKLSQIYGNIMSVGLGSDTWVILSGFDEIREFSMKSEATSRPSMPALIELYAFNEQLGVIFADGRLWRDQRRFMSKALKEIQSSYKPFGEQIMDEFNLFLAFLDNKQHHVFNGRDFFDIATLNIIWRLAAGERFDYENKRSQEMITHIESFTMEESLTILVGVSYARYLPYFRGIFQGMQEHMGKFHQFLWKIVAKPTDEHEVTYKNLFQHQLGKGGDFFTQKQLVISMLDFFTGGSGTLSKTLSFCILFMIQDEEMQGKIREEAQRFEEVSFEHLKQMPFTEAFISEVQRWASILPISPPREVTSSVNVAGFPLKVGQKVQMSLFAMHRDPQHWKDPQNFRPDRFLDPNNGSFVPDEWLQPFGYGKRKCLGEQIARQTVFLFLANLVKHFSFKAVEELPSLDPIGGLTLAPQQFKFKIMPIL